VLRVSLCSGRRLSPCLLASADVRDRDLSVAQHAPVGSGSVAVICSRKAITARVARAVLRS
jgi:hypothetical protein